MKKYAWLVLAVISLLGMIIVPGMAHSAQISIPSTLASVRLPQVVLPNYPVINRINHPQIQLPAPKIVPVNISMALPIPSAVTVPAARPEAAPARLTAGDALRQMNRSGSGSVLPSPARISALFDGAAKPAPIPVPAKPAASPAPAKNDSESNLTLPENDLLDEIGVGNN